MYACIMRVNEVLGTYACQCGARVAWIHSWSDGTRLTGEGVGVWMCRLRDRECLRACMYHLQV